MRFRLHVNQDLVAGLMFAVIGALGLWIGRRYPVGTSLRMGPGYMPNLLCWLLIIFGAGIGIKGALVAGEKLAGWHLRPLAFIVIGVLAFTFLIERAGLPIAALATVLIGSLASNETRPIEVVILAVSLAVASVLIFVQGLGLPMDIWPRWWG